MEALGLLLAHQFLLNEVVPLDLQQEGFNLFPFNCLIYVSERKK